MCEQVTCSRIAREKAESPNVWAGANHENEDVEDIAKKKIALFMNKPTSDDEIVKMQFANIHRLPRRRNIVRS